MSQTLKHADFIDTVWEYYRHHGRHDMPWRLDPNPYHVLVSEMMLQQTQVARARVKFAEFMAAFPTIQTLAVAPLGDVLRVWSGLGYNRRANYLHQAAQTICRDYGGKIPADMAELTALPGIGPNTAGAIMNYAFGVPTVFIETNTRTVYLHHFFSDSLDKVYDREILALLEQTMDREQPRQWYWALMDYGSHLKTQGLGRLHQSHQYKKQSPLAGSSREMRGRIIRQLTAGPQSDAVLRRHVQADDRYEVALRDLQAEGMVLTSTEGWCLKT